MAQRRCSTIGISYLEALYFPTVQPYLNFILSLLMCKEHIGYFSDICQLAKRCITHHIKGFIALGPPKFDEPVCSIHFFLLH